MFFVFRKLHFQCILIILQYIGKSAREIWYFQRVSCYGLRQCRRPLGKVVHAFKSKGGQCRHLKNNVCVCVRVYTLPSTNQWINASSATPINLVYFGEPLAYPGRFWKSILIYLQFQGPLSPPGDLGASPPWGRSQTRVGHRRTYKNCRVWMFSTLARHRAPERGVRGGNRLKCISKKTKVYFQYYRLKPMNTID